MGQETDLPDIKPEINREEKKRSGLAGLLSRLGLGAEAEGGLGAAGGFDGVLGAGVSGGILATKAGIIGLLLVGTTVAGSLGVVAYKMFGPQASDDDKASVSSLFSARPQNAANTPAGQNGSASKDGASQSLQYLVDANAKKESAAQDQTAAGPAAAPEAAQAAASSPAPLKNDSTASQSAAAKLKSDHKIGELSHGATSGSGGSMSIPGVGAPAANNASLLASSNRGGLSGMGSAAHASLGGMQGLRARTLGGGAARQLMGVRKDQGGATSSAGAGRTYDGSAAMPADAGGGSGGGAGATQGAKDANPPATGIGGGNPNSQFPSDVPSVTGTNVTPWQAGINTAMMMVMGASMLLLLASKLGKMGGSLSMSKIIICAIAGIAAMLGAAIIALGAQIGGGKYGQQLQGGLLAVAGGCIMATAAMLMVKVLGVGHSDAAKEGGKIPGSDGPNWQGDKTYTKDSAAAANKTADDNALTKAMGKDMNMLMMCGGGAAMAMAAWAYMAPKHSYSPSLFQNGRPPDWDNSYKPAPNSTGQVMPSEHALDQYLV